MIQLMFWLKLAGFFGIRNLSEKRRAIAAPHIYVAFCHDLQRPRPDSLAVSSVRDHGRTHE
jgi:hypothetical protein